MARSPKKSDVVGGPRLLEVIEALNSEEDAVNLSDVVPFLPESKLIALGANFVKGPDFAPFAVEDGRLITGQNPASSALVAQGLMKKANGQHAPYVD